MIEKSQKKSNKSRTISFVGIIWLISFSIMFRQLVSIGYWSCQFPDTSAFTSWAMQFADSLKNGVIYPRWTSLSFWGYGAPTFILYSPFAFYMTSFFTIFTGSVIVAMNIAKFAALFFAGTGMFFLVKEFYSDKTALLSASFYMLLPYNIFGIYVSWTFATAIAMIWFAPIMLFTYRFIKEQKFVNILYAGACYGCLILTHLISAYMFTFVIAGFVFYMSLVEKKLKLCMSLPLIITIGALLSSAYLLPLLHEKQLLNLGAFINYHYGDAFLLPDLSGNLPPNNFWHVYYEQFVSHGILLSFFTVLFAVYHIGLKKTENKENAVEVNNYFILTALITLFLLLWVSSIIWEIVPFFKFIQFPFRWLQITAFSVAYLSAACFRIMEYNCKTKKERYLKVVFIFMVFLICILPSFRYITNAMQFSKEDLLPGNTVNWTIEHLPANVDLERIEKDNNMKEKVNIVTGEGQTEIVDWQSEIRLIRVTSVHPLVIRIRTFYFPGWQAFIDGTQTEINKEDGTEAMLVSIPSGEHNLELKFGDTPVRYYSKLLTILSFFCITIFIVVLRIRKLFYKYELREDG